jgi:hypothetical protein
MMTQSSSLARHLTFDDLGCYRPDQGGRAHNRWEAAVIMADSFIVPPHGLIKR